MAEQGPLLCSFRCYLLRFLALVLVEVRDLPFSIHLSSHKNPIQSLIVNTINWTKDGPR
jgi:hypothetical protein